MALIDQKHREMRRRYLDQFALAEGPERRKLTEPDPKEFGPVAFSTRDLYDLYLYEFVKSLDDCYYGALKTPNGVLRGFAQAHAVASAQSMMLVHLMTRYEPC